MTPVAPPPGAGLDPLESSARTIRRLASRARADAVSVLTGLAEAIDEGRPELFGVDLAEAYPPDTLMADHPEPALVNAARALAIVRDVLVFAPIGVTWLFLWRALSQRVPDGTSFIVAWQDGFGGKVTSLGATSLVVAMLVGVIVLTTLAVAGVEWYGERRSSRATERHQLGTQLALATLALTRRWPLDSPVKLADLHGLTRQLGISSAELIGQLKTTTEEIRRSLAVDPLRLFSEALDKWSAAAAGLTAASLQMAAPVEVLERFVDMKERLATEEIATRTALNQLVDQVHHAATASAAGDQSHHSLIGNVRESVHQLGEAMHHFSDRATVLLETTDRVYDLLREVSGAPGLSPEQYGDSTSTNGAAQAVRAGPYDGRPEGSDEEADEPPLRRRDDLADEGWSEWGATR